MNKFVSTLAVIAGAVCVSSFANGCHPEVDCDTVKDQLWHDLKITHPRTLQELPLMYFGFLHSWANMETAKTNASCQDKSSMGGDDPHCDFPMLPTKCEDINQQYYTAAKNLCNNNYQIYIKFSKKGINDLNNQNVMEFQNKTSAVCDQGKNSNSSTTTKSDNMHEQCKTTKTSWFNISTKCMDDGNHKLYEIKTSSGNIDFYVICE